MPETNLFVCLFVAVCSVTAVVPSWLAPFLEATNTPFAKRERKEAESQLKRDIKLLERIGLELKVRFISPCLPFVVSH